MSHASRFALPVALFASLAITGCGDDPDSTVDAGADAGVDSGDMDTTEQDTTAQDTTAPSRLEANGCTYATATDMTGEATVDVTDIARWMVPHEVCIIVSAGTEVRFTGNFSNHPFTGGETGSEDPDSPFTAIGPGSGSGTLTTTLDAAGDFPYYCTLHLQLMQGVIYVDE